MRRIVGSLLAGGLVGLVGASLMLLLAIPTNGSPALSTPLLAPLAGALTGVLVAKSRWFGATSSATPGQSGGAARARLLAGGIAGLLLLGDAFA
jgi:hypothetical protein